MVTRTLDFDNGTIRQFTVRSDAGKIIGRDIENILTTSDINRATLSDRMQTALTANAAYLALANPTIVQTSIQVQRLTKEITGLIRLMFDMVADIADTQ